MCVAFHLVRRLVLILSFAGNLLALRQERRRTTSTTNVRSTSPRTRELDSDD
jgi:hypothetical protein